MTTMASPTGVKEKDMRKFLHLREFFIVGASADSGKYGHQVFQAFLDHGKHATPINPNHTSVCGHSTFKTVKDAVDEQSRGWDVSNCGVVVVTLPQITKQVLEDVHRVGGKWVWCQPGSEFDGIVNFCKEKEMRLICGGFDVMTALEGKEQNLEEQSKRVPPADEKHSEYNPQRIWQERDRVDVDSFLGLNHFLVAPGVGSSSERVRRIVDGLRRMGKKVTVVGRVDEKEFAGKDGGVDVDVVGSFREASPNLSTFGVVLATTGSDADETKSLLDQVKEGGGKWVWCEPGSEFDDMQECCEKSNIRLFWKTFDLVKVVEGKGGRGEGSGGGGGGGGRHGGAKQEKSRAQLGSQSGPEGVPVGELDMPVREDSPAGAGPRAAAMTQRPPGDEP